MTANRLPGFGAIQELSQFHACVDQGLKDSTIGFPSVFGEQLEDCIGPLYRHDGNRAGRVEPETRGGRCARKLGSRQYIRYPQGEAAADRTSRQIES